jgi:hypothetical protein
MIRVHANGVSDAIVGMRADRAGICRKLFKKPQSAVRADPVNLMTGHKGSLGG